MSNSALSGAAAGSLKTRIYSNIRGVDFSGKEVSTNRSPDMLNMWKNYANLGKCIETRPDLKKIIDFENSIYGMFFYKVSTVEHIIIHSGTSLYDYNMETKVKKIIKESGMNPFPSKSFIYNNILYIKDGLNYLEYDGETCKEVVGYIPTTTISKSPTGGGKTLEDVNLLTGLRKNSFCGDGESKVYNLDVETLTSTIVKVWINDKEITSGFIANASNGSVEFDNAPPKPDTDGQDNVVIQFEKVVDGYRDRINKCTLLSVFDNRVFFSGNQDYPNVIFNSSLDNPRYCSDTDYYNEGLDLSPVKALVAGNNNLWVFKQPSQSNTTVFYHTPTIDAEIGKCYPSNHSSIAIGCVATGINFNDDIIFFSDRGMEGINGDITTEQVLAHRSTLVDAKLLKENNYKNMILEEWKGYLLVIIDNKVYLADSQNMFTNQNHNEYEWFYWELSKNIICTVVKDDVLYLGTADGVYTLSQNETNINAYICTTKDVCGYPQMQKSTNKKGCVIDFSGENLKVEIKSDNEEFKIVDTFNNTKGYIVPKIKKKKWKDIQFKLSSSKPFSFERMVLEYYIGSYIKR